MAEVTRIKANLQSSEKASGRTVPPKTSSWGRGLMRLPWVCQVSEQVSSSVTALQAEKERLMRSVSEKEAALSSLRQAAQVQQATLQQEREKNSRELGELQGKLRDKVGRQPAPGATSSGVREPAFKVEARGCSSVCVCVGESGGAAETQAAGRAVCAAAGYHRRS